jgi:hypothetical protein
MGMSNRLVAISIRQHAMRTRDALFAAAVLCFTLLALAGLGVG